MKGIAECAAAWKGRLASLCSPSGLPFIMTSCLIKSARRTHANSCEITENGVRFKQTGCNDEMGVNPPGAIPITRYSRTDIQIRFSLSIQSSIRAYRP
jgi:hypothetical protein